VGYRVWPLDSVSGRVWYRPNDEWELRRQAGGSRTPSSSGRANIVRSTASGSWTGKNGMAISSVTAAYGRNNTDHGGRSAMFRRRVASRRLEHGVRPVRSRPGRNLPSADQHRRRGTFCRAEESGFRIDLRRCSRPRFLGGFEGASERTSVSMARRTLCNRYTGSPDLISCVLRLRPPAGSMGRMFEHADVATDGGPQHGMPMHHPMP